jgi:hypothetical protein
VPVPSNLLVKEILFLPHCSFQHGSPHSMSLCIASLPAKLPDQLKYSTFCFCFYLSQFALHTGCLEIPITSFSDTFLSTARHSPIQISLSIMLQHAIQQHKVICTSRTISPLAPEFSFKF